MSLAPDPTERQPVGPIELVTTSGLSVPEPVESVSPEMLADLLVVEPPRNPVVDQQPRKLPLELSHSSHGRAMARIVTLEDGRRQEVITGIPRRQRSDIPITLGTALGYSVYGHNWLTMCDMLDLGFPVVMVGPEGGKADWPRTPAAVARLVQHLASINLLETAGNMHEILGAVDREGLYEPGEVIKIGESRDAVVGMAFHAMARRYGRHVLYGDYTAGCFPERPEKAQDYIALPGQAVSQVARLLVGPLKKPWERARYYPHSINPNPYFMLHVAATIPTLLSGRAGPLAHSIARDSKIHNTGFVNDPWTNLDVWDEIFADHPFVVNTRLPGDHSTFTDEPVLQARVERLRGLRDELEASRHRPQAINWEHVHMGGRLAIAKTLSSKSL